MARKFVVSMPLMVLLCLGSATHAHAALIDLFDWAFHTDGTTVDSLTLSPGGYYTPTAADLLGLGGTIDVSDFNFSSAPGSGGGLGTVRITVDTAGAHFVGMFVDHEIDESSNTFFNETGTAVGSVAPGQSWEIDEPDNIFGDIFTHFFDGDLENATGVPVSAPDDVSMALGWNFTLAAMEVAVLSFRLTETAPGGGFFLSHTDPESAATIYFSSTINIRPGETTPIPEPGTLALLGPGLLALLWYGHRRMPCCPDNYVGREAAEKRVWSL